MALSMTCLGLKAVMTATLLIAMGAVRLAVCSLAEMVLGSVLKNVMTATLLGVMVAATHAHSKPVAMGLLTAERHVRIPTVGRAMGAVLLAGWRLVATV